MFYPNYNHIHSSELIEKQSMICSSTGVDFEVAGGSAPLGLILKGANYVNSGPHVFLEVMPSWH